jgi:hypothetical protein
VHDQNTSGNRCSVVHRHYHSRSPVLIRFWALIFFKVQISKSTFLLDMYVAIHAVVAIAIRCLSQAYLCLLALPFSPVLLLTEVS